MEGVHRAVHPISQVGNILDNEGADPRHALINFKLSTEILCQIFHEATPGHRIPDVSQPMISTARLKQVLRITHVCGTWRDIALGMPSLWTEIHDKNADVYQTFLERSGNMPLCLGLCEDIENSPASLAEVSARVRSLYLPQLMISRQYTTFPSLSFPLLECLIVLHDELVETGSVPSALGLSFSAPNLRAIALTPSSARFLDPSRFPALTHIHISNRRLAGFSWLHFHPLLAHTPLLESLHVECGREEPAQDPPPGTLALPRLKNVTLLRVGLHWLFLFLERTQLPADARVAAAYCGMWNPAEIRALPPLPLLASVDRVAMIVNPSETQFVAVGAVGGALSIGVIAFQGDWIAEEPDWMCALSRAMLESVPRANIAECWMNVGLKSSHAQEAEHVCRVLGPMRALRALRLCVRDGALLHAVCSGPLVALSALEELALRISPRSADEVCPPLFSVVRERTERGYAVNQIKLHVRDLIRSSDWTARFISAFETSLTPAREHVRSLVVCRDNDAAWLKSPPTFSDPAFWFGRNQYWVPDYTRPWISGWDENWVRY